MSLQKRTIYSNLALSFFPMIIVWKICQPCTLCVASCAWLYSFHEFFPMWHFMKVIFPRNGYSFHIVTLMASQNVQISSYGFPKEFRSARFLRNIQCCWIFHQYIYIETLFSHFRLLIAKSSQRVLVIKFVKFLKCDYWGFSCLKNEL